ncbi:MAG TPA: FAD-dependent oxidoreductase [Albitalea sp.]
MDAFDVAIVGAGIAGASLAWRLAPHRRVVLLERESQPGYHSTGRSAAMFMESYGPPAVRALTRASRAFCERPPAGFGDAPLLSPRGVLYVATHAQAALMRELHETLAPACPALRVLDAGEALAHVPCLRPEALHGALHDPQGEDIDVHALHQGFLRGLKAAGGVLRTGAPLARAQREDDGWRLVIEGGEPLRARTVVDAAGAWADEVARLAGAPPVGLVPRRRTAFTFAAPPGVDVARWPAVVGVDEGWYVKPDAGRLLGSPANADDTVPHDVLPEAIDVATGIHRIEQATTLAIRRPLATWAGLRSFVADGEPVIGFDPACPGFFWLAGQGGYGIQSAAGASALAASLLLGEPLPDELRRHGVEPAGVSPRRFR